MISREKNSNGRKKLSEIKSEKEKEERKKKEIRIINSEIEENLFHSICFEMKSTKFLKLCFDF